MPLFPGSAPNDTIRRLRHAGRLVELSEDSYLVRLVDALLSLDRERLDRSIARAKKVLSDWAGQELDRWWGAILSLERVKGVDDPDQFLGDERYVERIRSYMEAASMGISLEAVRRAAEAGSGTRMQAYSASGRVILLPEEPITAAQRAGALRAARRLAPARSVIEIGEMESLAPEMVKHAYSESYYIGEQPTREGMSGGRYDSPNMTTYVFGRLWDRSDAGGLVETDGLPTNLMRGGVWHTPPLGFGRKAEVEIGLKDEPVNRIKVSLSTGSWRVEVFAGQELLLSESLVISRSWYTLDRLFRFVRVPSIRLSITQTAQEMRELYAKGLYVGARVNRENRVDWLALGGLEGRSGQNLVSADAKGIVGGGGWISEPAPDPNHERILYATLSSVPRRVEALYFRTKTPGAIFRLAFSNDRVASDEDFPRLRWTDTPGIYEMRNGRVRVSPFTGQHVKITITNLRPMLMKDFEPEEEG